MKTFRCLLLGLLITGASVAFGGVPAVTVTISDAGGNLAYQGSTNPGGIFRTGNLSPGHYVVQFRSTNGALQNNQYLLVVSAGKKKVIADAVRGEQFAGGGVAMKLQVTRAMNVEGQIASEQTVSVAGNFDVKVINGRRYLWVQNPLGSNLGPHWEEEGVGLPRNIVSVDKRYIRYIQDLSGEGSIANRYQGSMGSAEAGEYHGH